MSDLPDDPDLLAAEYALGSLDAEERAALQARIAADPAFRQSVEAWERRLAPLSRLSEQVPPPPDLWDRIAATTGSGVVVKLQTAPRRALRLWQGATAGALAIAAALAAFILVRSPAPPEVAMLMPSSGSGPALLALAEPRGHLTIRPAAALAPLPAGRDLELWALPQGATRPHPMGVLPPSGRRLDMTLAPGTRILVSLEPKGGSPSGLPTGPVVYAGRLERYVE